MGTPVNVLWGPASLIGFRVSGDTNTDLDDADDKIAVRFCIPKDGTIDRVGFYIMQFNGAPPDYKVTLETLNADGEPSGADYGGSAFGGFSPAGVGHLWVSLGTNATVVAGDLVAAVIGPQEVAPDGANSIDILNNVLGDELGLPDRFQYSISWTNGQGPPPIAVRYTDDSVYGLSVTSFEGEEFDQADTPDEAGSKFAVPADMVCFGARVTFNSAGSNASFDIRLYNAAHALIGSVVVDDEDKVWGATATAIDVFWDEVNLVKDAVYRLVVASTHASSRVQPARLTFPDADSRNWMPEGSRWSGTERTDGGGWTDEALEMGFMGVWVNDIDFGGNGAGVEPMAGLIVG